jgi:hypothetical protein
MSERGTWQVDRGHRLDSTPYVRLSLLVEGERLWSWPIPLLPDELHERTGLIEELRKEGLEIPDPPQGL